MYTQKDAMRIVFGLIAVGVVIGAVIIGGPVLLAWIFG
jgi:hypothetical protein